MFLPVFFEVLFKYVPDERPVALKWAGLVVMLYTASAMAGTYLLCRISSRVSNNKLIIFAGAAGIVLQSLMSLCPDMISFVAVRMAQTAMIAAIIPLTISIFASDLSGKTIGFLNSGRFAGNAMGPVIGTSVYAFSGLNWLCIFISVLSLCVLLSFANTYGRTTYR
jgi:MFS family permease